MRHTHAAEGVVGYSERPVHDSPEIESWRLLSGLMADLADSVNGLTLRGARCVPIGTASGGTARPLSSGAAGRLVGWSLRESSGTAGVLVRIYDGHDSNGTLMATIPLAAATVGVTGPESSTESLPQGGLSITDGLILVLSDPLNPSSPATGTVEGSVWIGAAE